MAQAETRPTSAIVGGTSKVRIKLKLPLGAKKTLTSGAQFGTVSSTGDQLLDLHAAVEAFCRHGVRGLPGAVLLSPWREPSPFEHLAVQQQANGLNSPGFDQPQQQLPEQQQGQPTKRRVRKRREPEAAAADGGESYELQYLARNSVKRRRSNTYRAPRDTVQLSSSIHSMLQPVSAERMSPAPASPSVVSQPQAAGAVVASMRGRSVSATAAKAAAQQPSRLQRSSGQQTPAPEAVVPTPAAVPASSSAAVPSAPPPTAAKPMAAVPEAAGVEAMDVDQVAARVPTPVAAVGSLSSVDRAAPAADGTSLNKHSSLEQEQLQQAQVAEAGAPAVLKQQQPEANGANQQQQQQVIPQQGQVERSNQEQQPDTKEQHAQGPLQETAKQQKPKHQQLQQTEIKPDKKQLDAAQQAVCTLESKQATVQEPAAAPVVDGILERASVGKGKPVPAAEADAAPQAAADASKPNSPPSETSHQQHIIAAAPQHLQQLLPTQAPVLPGIIEQPKQQPQQEVQQELAAPDLPVQVLQQQKQPEQTAVSRDRSQCSLPRGPEAPRGPAAVSMPAPAALPAALLTPAVAAAGAAGSGRLLELAPGVMTPAARALAALSAVPEVRQRILPPEDRPVRTQEEALSYLSTIMEKAKQLKHQGDRRNKTLGNWDVFGLSFYALSTVEFLMYWDTAIRLLNKLRSNEQAVERLQQQINNLTNAQFLRQTGQLSTTAMNICSNCKGPDVAKQALRMLLERLSAISSLRNLHNQRKQLESHIRLLKSNGASLNVSNSSGNGVRTGQQQGQQQARQQLQIQRPYSAQQNAAAGKPPSPSGSSWSPAGQQNFNKRSPDDSNTSNQERLQLPPGSEHVAGAALGVNGAGGAAGHGLGVQTERALALAKSERALADSMQELLKMTDGMHQTVMRMQQFLESPDVLASEHARAAALHISVLGLDAGMFSIPRVAAHTEAAVTSITKLLRTGS